MQKCFLDFQPCYIWKRAHWRLSYFLPFYICYIFNLVIFERGHLDDYHIFNLFSLLFFSTLLYLKEGPWKIIIFSISISSEGYCKEENYSTKHGNVLLLSMTYPLYLDINRKDKLLRPNNGGNLLVYSINHFISFILWRVKNIKDFINSSDIPYTLSLKVQSLYSLKYKCKWNIYIYFIF